ncbi:MAG: class I SAM-dependent methyltransferase [Candidatus Ratteibacteria bacterium]|nr:class I SAM-dependent methyltransferase [Candidatus Ratteibacteria bacterium]
MNENFAGLEEEKKIKDKIVKSLINYWKYLNVRKYCKEENAVRFFLDEEKNKRTLINDIEKAILSLEGKSVLDVGCGKGSIVVYCALKGAVTFGIDIDEEEIKIAKLRVASYGLNKVGIFKGDVEHMPFPDNSFDLVTATSLLEHVENFEKAIKEMVRVTKPGGFCYVTGPNPLYPREGHYKTFFVPYLPKQLGKIYLILRRFNPDFFIKHVKYPYPSMYRIKKIFMGNDMEIEDLTTKFMLSKIGDISSIKNKWIRNIVKILNKIGMRNLMIKGITISPFYSNYCILGKKQ